MNFRHKIVTQSLLLKKITHTVKLFAYKNVTESPHFVANKISMQSEILKKPGNDPPSAILKKVHEK